MIPMRAERLQWWMSGGFFLLLAVLSWIGSGSLVGSVAILFILLFEGHVFGRLLFPSEPKWLRTAFGILTLLATQTLIQTAWYYLGGTVGYQSDFLSLATSILVMEIALMVMPVKTGVRPTERDADMFWRDKKKLLWGIVTVVPALIAAYFVLAHAHNAATVETVNTPWPLLPHGTLAAIAVLFFCVLLAAWMDAAPALVAGLSGLTLLSVSLIAPLIYKIGFGFDGFLHRASERILLTTGTLTPHPPYYIGQYTLVTWLARLLHAPIDSFDTFLVPLAVVLIPLALLFVFPWKKSETKWPIVGASLLLSLGFAVATTPQSFAYVLGIIALCLALAVKRGAHPYAALAFAFWSTAAHPLAGLPFLGATCLLLWSTTRKKQTWRSPLPWIIVGLTVLAVPAAFFVNGWHSAAHIDWHFSSLFHLSAYADVWRSLIPPSTHIALWADWAAFVSYLAPFILVALAVTACIKKTEHRASWIWLTVAGAGLLLAGLFLQATGEFTFLIDYERGNYADRLFLIAQFFFLLPALDGFSLFLQNGFKKSTTVVVTVILFLMGWQAAQAYLALPRHDATVVGHGWSVSAADEEAVRWIEENANGQPYTVLADQSVSAAAVDAFGFKRYVGDVFYYPIPTGGPLYQIYLQAAADGTSRATIQKAAALGQSRIVYVVLNDYWWDADRVAEELKGIADQTQDIQNGKDRIYRFDFSNDKKESR